MQSLPTTHTVVDLVRRFHEAHDIDNRGVVYDSIECRGSVARTRSDDISGTHVKKVSHSDSPAYIATHLPKL